MDRRVFECLGFVDGRDTDGKYGPVSGSVEGLWGVLPPIEKLVGV